ncbi:hypothetical protein PHLCEN_2v13390, partial [Hermanssonia centrifuga]
MSTQSKDRSRKWCHCGVLCRIPRQVSHTTFWQHAKLARAQQAASNAEMMNSAAAESTESSTAGPSKRAHLDHTVDENEDENMNQVPQEPPIQGDGYYGHTKSVVGYGTPSLGLVTNGSGGSVGDSKYAIRRYSSSKHAIGYGNITRLQRNSSHCRCLRLGPWYRRVTSTSHTARGDSQRTGRCHKRG